MEKGTFFKPKKRILSRILRLQIYYSDISSPILSVNVAMTTQPTQHN